MAKGAWQSCSVVTGMVAVEVMRPLTVCTWSPLTRMIEMDIGSTWISWIYLDHLSHPRVPRRLND